ncbi:MAG: hypothetical protein WCG78_00180 [Candidatus Omnitrophota bacterium]
MKLTLSKNFKKTVSNAALLTAIIVGIIGITVMVLALLGKFPYSTRRVVAPFCFLMSILLSVFQAAKEKIPQETMLPGCQKKDTERHEA